ncbi:MAG TPA: multicopper oxidase family protein [Candidatus Saccharimonadales bacterium]|jgi:FtsP/CotA-like multicopper oxidase with cupredoxin domain|nr:multicopper oxidase family protein [Candidatus Saccharimonadales bacterium]
MSTLNGPYANTGASPLELTGVLPAPVLETHLIASRQTINIGGGVMANAEVLNGEIPGPTFRLTVGQTVVVRLVNLLSYELGIHWHGVELENYSDGTEVTQDGAVPAPILNGAVAGGTFLYKFKVPRAGIFWYHPHHGNSINRVFRGLYGMIVVTDPAEAAIVAPAAGAVLPANTDTMELVLSDITVCKAPAMGITPSQNDTATYMNADPTAEWLSGVTAQFATLSLSPKDFCEISPKNDDGGAAAVYLAGDIPSIATTAAGPRVEGQTVLTNGVNVGGRAGTPALPGALAAGAVTKSVVSGQGLRIRIVNCAHLRYFRLRLTTQAGAQVDLLRIGGEGGLLDNVLREGGTLGTVPDPSAGAFFTAGELLLPPAGRADVVAAIPGGLPVGSVLTLWTRDCQRTGGGVPASNNWAEVPTVPVMHLQVVAGAAAYTIAIGDSLRSLAGMPAVEILPAPGVSDHLLNPATFGKPGLASEEIKFQAGGNPTIDGVSGVDLMMNPVTMMPYAPYTNSPHIGSTRYAENGRLLELTITNTTNAHHPFHLHGFSFQPKSIHPELGGAALYTWPYNEFRDTIDLLPHTRLIIRARLDDRPLANGTTTGGAFGRWLFHCHIFFHHTHGMISELVVTSATGAEKPNVNVGGSFAYAPTGLPATRHGTFHHPDPAVNITSLTVTRGAVVPSPALPANAGSWTWSYTPVAGDPPFDYVYIEATDAAGRKDQAVFRLQMGGLDTSSDLGDPHIRTVLGPKYDFQAAGEFTLLRDDHGMEIQVRQTPAATPPPVTDDYTQLTECVSLNSAVAVRVGSHRISYQPWRESIRLLFFLDGKPANLPQAGLDLDAHRVTTFNAGGETGIRIDYAHGPIVRITPNLWGDYGIYYLNVEVTNTDAQGGLMGRIPNGTWLPALPSGATLGPMPVDLNDRYVALYRTFADAWRLTDASSLFEYLPGRSTATFTARDWPPQKPPCTTVPRGFPKPVKPVRENIPVNRAKQICKGVTLHDLNAACVFDVASTGDETFAKAYLVAQELRLCATAVHIAGNKPQTKPREPLLVTAVVLPLTPGRPAPLGNVTFIVDGVPMKPSAKLDKHGRARTKVVLVKEGVHKVRAEYVPGRENKICHSSSSPNLLHTVSTGRVPNRGNGPNTGHPHTGGNEKNPVPPMGAPMDHGPMHERVSGDRVRKGAKKKKAPAGRKQTGRKQTKKR